MSQIRSVLWKDGILGLTKLKAWWNLVRMFSEIEAIGPLKSKTIVFFLCVYVLLMTHIQHANVQVGSLKF